MAWRDELRPASFRGVPFLVDGSDQKLGRRAVQNEYPGRDEPYSEDMGRRAWADSIQAFVLGDDHLQQAARLADALNQYGPGELVHPYIGTRQVQIGEVSLSHSSREGGKSTFTIEVMEAGPAQSPSVAANTDIALQGSCSAAQAALEEDFLERYDLARLPQGLIDELAVRYNDALNLLAPLRATVATGMDMANQVLSIAALLADPQALIDQLLADVYGMFGLSSPNERSASWAAPQGASVELIQDVLGRLPQVEKTRIVPAYQTPSRQAQVATQDQLLDLLQGTVVITSGLTSSEVTYADRTQAGHVQDAFLDALEQTQLQAGDALYEALQEVKTDMVDDLNQRGADLPSVTTVTPVRTLPALVQSYRLYQDATREQEMVARNHLDHPGFVPAGEPLEIVR